MQVANKRCAGLIGIRSTWPSRCSGCWPTPPGSSCCGRYSGSCRSTTSPSPSASPRPGFPSTWRSCGWPGSCGPAGRAPRCSTGSRTSTSPARQGRRPPAEHAGDGVPAHHRADADRSTAAAAAGALVRAMRARPRRRARQHDHDHGHDHEPRPRARARRRAEGLAASTFRAAQPRRRGLGRRRAGVQRPGHPGGQDQPRRPRRHRRAPARRRGCVTGSVALLADTIHNFSDALTAVPLWIAFVARPPAPPPGATPTATAAPRTSPGCSSSR